MSFIQRTESKTQGCVERVAYTDATGAVLSYGPWRPCGTYGGQVGQNGEISTKGGAKRSYRVEDGGGTTPTDEAAEGLGGSFMDKVKAIDRKVLIGVALGLGLLGVVAYFVWPKKKTSQPSLF